MHTVHNADAGPALATRFTYRNWSKPSGECLTTKTDYPFRSIGRCDLVFSFYPSRLSNPNNV